MNEHMEAQQELPRRYANNGNPARNRFSKLDYLVVWLATHLGHALDYEEPT